MVKFSTRIVRYHSRVFFTLFTDNDLKLFTPEAHLYAGEKKYHSEEWTGKSFV